MVLFSPETHHGSESHRNFGAMCSVIGLGLGWFVGSSKWLVAYWNRDPPRLTAVVWAEVHWRSGKQKGCWDFSIDFLEISQKNLAKNLGDPASWNCSIWKADYGFMITMQCNIYWTYENLAARHRGPLKWLFLGIFMVLVFWFWPQDK